jgi:hypothetical protein
MVSPLKPTRCATSTAVSSTASLVCSPLPTHAEKHDRTENELGCADNDKATVEPTDRYGGARTGAESARRPHKLTGPRPLLGLARRHTTGRGPAGLESG